MANPFTNTLAPLLEELGRTLRFRTADYRGGSSSVQVGPRHVLWATVDGWATLRLRGDVWHLGVANERAATDSNDGLLAEMGDWLRGTRDQGLGTRDQGLGTARPRQRHRVAVAETC